MNVMHVEKPLKSQTSLYIREHTQEKNLTIEMDVRSVELYFSSHYTRIHTGRSSVDILNVREPSSTQTGLILLQSRLQQMQDSLVK